MPIRGRTCAAVLDLIRPNQGQREPFDCRSCVMVDDGNKATFSTRAMRDDVLPDGDEVTGRRGALGTCKNVYKITSQPFFHDFYLSVNHHRKSEITLQINKLHIINPFTMSNPGNVIGIY